MQRRKIGTRAISAIRLGGMPMSIEGRPSRAQSIRTIHAALDEGVTFIDTADSYHRDAGEVGHNESLIADALSSYGAGAEAVLVATKAGHKRPGDGSWTIDGHPDYIKAAAKASALRLGVEAIGLFQHHRPDPQVDYADSIGAVKDLLDEGVILMGGISNASVDQMNQARQILGADLVSVQNQFSPAHVSTYDTLLHCAEMGLAFLPWSPLGGISGASKVGALHLAFQQVADAHGVSPQQVALAWELMLAPVVIPTPGSSRPETIIDSVKAADLVLSVAQVELLTTSVGLTPESELT